MAKYNNAMEIFKLLEKTNCRECNEPTCLAFAAAVFRGQRQLSECSRIDKEIIERLGLNNQKTADQEQDIDETLEILKRKISAIDLPASADRVGGTFCDNRLTIKILGKDFSVDTKGNLSSDIHMHQWIVFPVLNYIIDSAGIPVTGKWVPLRELKSGQTWYRLFGQRCEKPLKKVADTYTDLFEDMIHLFNGRKVENHYESDISLVLHPLPKVPMLICYWKPDEGLESDLNLFFDSTAEDNLNIESIFALGTGLVRMFEKIALRHGIR
jgi:hypothetical protein